MNLEHYKKEYHKIEEARAEMLTNAMAELFKDLVGHSMDDHDLERLLDVMRFAR